MPQPEPSPDLTRRGARGNWMGAALVGIFALGSFGYDLASEPHFVDESAYLSQAYYADLLLSGKFDHPQWLEYPAYDLPPLPKYLFGAALRLGGHAVPGPSDARAWYADTSRRFVPPEALVAARWPAVILGALGGMAVYGLGVLGQDRRVGLLAALLLIENPLYRLHARRAMSDVMAEAFLLMAAALTLWAWRRLLSGGRPGKGWAVAALAGVCAGLAPLAKLNGGLAMIVSAAWTALAVVLPGYAPARTRNVVLATCLAGVVALMTFVALNPFLTAHPAAPPAGARALARMSIAARARFLVRFRMDVSRGQQQMFSHNALTTAREKLRTVAVQGFGRFGPFGPRHTPPGQLAPTDSTRRYDWHQDWGALIWLPWVGVGAVWAARRGAKQRRDGQPPTAWALLVYSALALAVVTAYLPLAWDRYFLSIQPGSALLAAGALVATFDRVVSPGKGLIVRRLRSPETWVFVILLASYAFYWQGRDWNSASRLMLTYALVDRGTIALNGLDDQTHDIARVGTRFYTDKQPGFSVLATVPYALARTVGRLPAHPLDRPGFAFWPADYWVTLGTSGVCTALAAVVLVGLARDIGCGPRRAALVGLAYGLATPAYAYATLSYGHQAAACALIASFALLWRPPARRPTTRLVAAGFLAALASVIELQVGPVSALLGLYLIALVLGGRRRLSALGDFAVGAAVPTACFLGYNQLAFGSIWDQGYFHLVASLFRGIHSRENPLGLHRPEGAPAWSLLWGGYRGLFFYAPILLLALLGWIALAARRVWGMATVALLAALAVFLVNLSYPAWDGGWTTGPRLLLPLIPFAMLPVAGLLARGGRGTTAVAVALTLAGGILMLLFVGVGARIPQFIDDPLRGAVWPLWRGDPVPAWASNGRFARNLARLAFPDTVARLPAAWQWCQFLPLVIFQGAALMLMSRGLKEAENQPQMTQINTDKFRI